MRAWSGISRPRIAVNTNFRTHKFARMSQTAIPRSTSSAAPLAQALDHTLALMMDDRISSLKQYFQEQAAASAKANARILALEQELEQRAGLEDELSEAWERIEALEQQRQDEGVTAAELEQKVQDLAEVIEQGVHTCARGPGTIPLAQYNPSCGNHRCRRCLNVRTYL